MVEIDPRGWLLKEIDFEKSDEENLFQLEHAACVLGRLKRGRGAGQEGQDEREGGQGPGRGLEAREARVHPARDVCRSVQRRRGVSRCLDRGSLGP